MGGITDAIGLGGEEYDAPASSGSANWISRNLYKKSRPVRTRMFKDLAKFQRGKMDFGSSPMWAPGKNAIEDQYGVARENIMGNVPAGGALVESLSNLEADRAGDFTDLTGQIGQDMLNKAYGITTQIPQTSLGGLGTAAAGESQAMMANAQADAGKSGMMGDLGEGAGMYFGGK